MKVLYVSKALVVAAYREKIREMERLVAIRSVMPGRWGGEPPEPSPHGLLEPERVPVRLAGHNHLHHYARPERWLGRPAPDLVHIDEEPYSLVTLQLARACRRRGIPCLFFAWQNVQRRLPPPFGSVRTGVFRLVRGGIAGTDGAAVVLRAAGYTGPLAIIPQFGVDPGRFKPDAEGRRRTLERLDIPETAFVIGYAGRLVPEKGVGKLLHAFIGLAPEPADSVPPHLVIIGAGPERHRLEAQARAAGVADRVRFLGQLASLEMPGALSALDVLALPSVATRTWSEQFGRVLVEAMACGVPVVGTSTGEIPTVVDGAGVLVPPGDVAALAGALDRLRGSPDVRSILAERGRRRVLERYSHAEIARATADFYRRILDEDPS